MTNVEVQFQIDLSGLPGRLRLQMQEVTHRVAIGLNAGKRITPDSLSIPDVSITHDYDADNPWTPEQASQSWNLWVLQNGFRDVAETIAGALEEIQKVMALWVLSLKKKKGQALTLADYNNAVSTSVNKFHRKTLPQKFDFLAKEYQFQLETDYQDQLLSINAARNCLVHRGGVIGTEDTQGGKALVMTWVAMASFLFDELGEREIQLPYHHNNPNAFHSVKQVTRTKQFPLGAQLTVTAQEFSELTWGLYMFAVTAAKRMETYANGRGLMT